MKKTNNKKLRRCFTGICLCGTALFFGMPAHALPPEDIQLRDETCLRAAYPDAVQGLRREGDVIWLELHNEKRVIYADERPDERDSDGVLLHATVSQMLHEPYPVGVPTSLQPSGDAGRERSTEFMQALYGENPHQLRLEDVRIGKSKIRFSGKHGAAAALRRVAATLEELARDPALRKIIFPLGGGQHWRTIAGTDRLSAHSFGIAIDLNPKQGAYWRWTDKRPPAYPQAIVDAFEAQGFIWGGRWTHFDAMHFEYRPDLLCVSPRSAATGTN